MLLTRRALTGHFEQCVGSRLGRMRCSEQNLLCVPCTKRHWGDIAFSVTFTAMTTAGFKVKVKTYLFSRTFCTAL